MPKVLFFYGGWPGHQPEKIMQLFADRLAALGFAVESVAELERLKEEAWLASFDLIFPCWTMGDPSPDAVAALVRAVRSGVGLAGVHGGMGDAFRGRLDYEWMVGGHFVGHPHVGSYTVRWLPSASGLAAGLPEPMAYQSEQYYLLVDPGIEVLGVTDYEFEGRRCEMPVAWIKQWGRGRVFYCALGHAPEEFERHPELAAFVVRGCQWAARSE